MGRWGGGTTVTANEEHVQVEEMVSIWSVIGLYDDVHQPKLNKLDTIRPQQNNLNMGGKKVYNSTNTKH